LADKPVGQGAERVTTDYGGLRPVTVENVSSQFLPLRQSSIKKRSPQPLFGVNMPEIGAFSSLALHCFRPK
jgi:hypothetical protein